MAYFVSGLFQTLGALVLLGTHEIFEYPSTLANSTLIMLKFSNFISSKLKNIVKKNSEYLRIFHVLK
jgi:hypothetical protein